MGIVKSLLLNCIRFAVQVLLLCYAVARQIVLPGKGSKGNLLSSLFMLFAGIAEKVLELEKSIFKRSWLLQHRVVKLALVVTAGFFFLLSSFEWQGDAYLPQQQNIAYAGENIVSSSPKTKNVYNKLADDNAAYTCTINRPVTFFQPQSHCICKRYIVYGVLRI